MKMLHDTPLSMLDLVAVREGGTVADALAISLRTAQHAEALGFKRYWLAEHHNMPGIASSATAVLVGYIAAGTQKFASAFRAESCCLNHALLVVAEAFGTLAELYPNRIDLGLGHRAPTKSPCAHCAVTGWKLKPTFHGMWLISSNYLASNKPAKPL